MMMDDNARYDAAFRDFLRVMLTPPPRVCAFCDRTTAQHIRAGFLDEITDGHYFIELSLN
jgi:hypothetical protein